MQNGDKWMTVKDFAKTAGVSDKAVYDRLKKDLKAYLKSENGRKYIHSDALKFVGAQVNSSQIQADSSEFKLDSSRIQADSSEFKPDSSQIQADSSGFKPNSSKIQADSSEFKPDSSQIQADSSEFKLDSSRIQAEFKPDSSDFKLNSSWIQALEKKLEETQTELNAVNLQVSAQIAEIDRLKEELENTLNELKRTRADLEAAREQRQKAEIRAAAAEAAEAAERKRADAAEQQCRVKDDQAAHSAQTVTALTAALQTAQQQAGNLTKALENSQALQAGQIRLAMQDGEQDLSADYQPKKKRGLFGGLFHKGNKDG